MKTRRLLALLLALVMVVGLLAACGGTTPTETKTDDNTEAGPSSIAVCIASEPDTIDPALNSAVDGATLLAHLFSGLAKWAQDSTGKLVIVADAAKELVDGVVNDDGTVTYTYTLRDGLKWSDGQDVKASDFVFSWKRAVSEELAADYGYMFEVVKGYNEGDLAVEAPDDKTIVVTLYNAVAYWNELLAFPTYFPVREDVVANEAWATDPSTYVCNGMYTLDSWDHNSVITLKKNENHPDAAEVTMDTIQFYLSDDANNMLTNFKNGDWLLIDDVPTNEIAALKTEYPDEFFTVGQLGTYYVCWNINEDILPADTTLTGAEAEAARSEIRNALSLLIDRNYIIDEIAQGGQLPASSFVAMGLTDADGSQFYENAGHNDGFIGYYDASSEAVESNYEKAVEILKKYYEFDADGKITNFPAITYLYNTSEGHQAIGEYIQSAFANVGINMSMENQEWATFLNTRKAGDYSVARNGWLADYNDPISFLDMWTTSSGNNDVQFGKGANADLKIYKLDVSGIIDGVPTVENGTWAETYDELINLIKSTTDDTTRYALMHVAEDMLMDTGCLTPIYYYTDQYMLSSKVKGFFSNPLGYKYFMYTTVEA